MVETGKPIASNSMSRFAQGFGYPFRAIEYARGHGLMGKVAAPLFIGALIYLAFLVGMYFFFDDMVQWFWARPDSDSWWIWLVLPLWYVFTLILRVLLLGLSMIFFVVVTLVVTAPFNSLLSERVEFQRLGTPEPSFEVGRTAKDILYAVKDLVLYLLLFVGVSLGLLLLNFVPLFGNVASAILGALFTWMLFALQFLDYPLARRYMKFGAKWKVVRRNLALSSGFGLAVFVALLVPIAGMFLMPFACIGGTLMYSDMVEGGLLPKTMPVGLSAPKEVGHESA